MAPDVWGRRVAGGNRGGSGSARWPPDRRHAVRQRRMAMPLPWKPSGLLGSRRANAATNRQSVANRALSSAAYWALIGRLLAVKAHASALRTSRSRLRTRSCWATSRSRTIMFSPVSPDGPPARAYAVVRRTRRRGGAVRVAAAVLATSFIRDGCGLPTPPFGSRGGARPTPGRPRCACRALRGQAAAAGSGSAARSPGAVAPR